MCPTGGTQRVSSLLTRSACWTSISAWFIWLLSSSFLFILFFDLLDNLTGAKYTQAAMPFEPLSDWNFPRKFKSLSEIYWRPDNASDASQPHLVKLFSFGSVNKQLIALHGQWLHEIYIKFIIWLSRWNEMDEATERTGPSSFQQPQQFILHFPQMLRWPHEASRTSFESKSAENVWYFGERRNILWRIVGCER